MYERLLEFLRCPACRHELSVHVLRVDEDGSEMSEALLSCQHDHWFPVVRGIPRMLPDALQANWPAVERYLSGSSLKTKLADRLSASPRPTNADRRTRQHFSLEWKQHELGDRTWGIDLERRVEEYFLRPLGVTPTELEGMTVLDAGCGNGSQAVAYTEFGPEIIAIDMSSGLEHGHAFRRIRPGARPERVHFVQADLQQPPLAVGSVDIVHSAGVLHHTPDTHRSFRILCPLLRPGGLFYVWVYSYEPLVTPLVNGIRSFTTRLSPTAMERTARIMAPAFQQFCRIANDFGVRSYPTMKRREAALALMDIFGPPFAHYHSIQEVERWFREAGFDTTWVCNESRRGFGVCGRRSLGVRSDLC